MRVELREWAEEVACRAGLSGLPSARTAALAVGAAVVALLLLARWPIGGGGSQGAPAVPASAGEVAPAAEATPSVPASITIHVVGAVHRPGVYVLATGSRACDAVAAAGGMLGSAEQAAVNLARILDDGEQLVFPRKGEAVATAQAGAAAAGAAGAAPAGGKVDINRAGEGELDALPGIGPATAKKIVDDRAANGPFRSVEDLLRVPGIGPAKLDAMKDLVTVG